MVSGAFADFYLHAIPGSNNRLNEANTNRNNANRVFNSQNNGQGGYCWGPSMSFYEGSHLSLEWTSQHSCGNQNAQCQVILQYMCSDNNGDDSQKIRDGTTTNTINQGNMNTLDTATGEFMYGMHEPYSYFQSCNQRSRNKGLFTADQNVNNNGAQSTRQNQNGGTNGFECQEERDYYPYWHPSPWKDIAVLTTDTDNCGFYKANSQNVMAKNYCNGTTNAQLNANNEQDCLTANGQWLSTPSWGIPAPACKEAPWGRDNHLGNGMDGHTHSYNWTIPRKGRESCIGSDSCSCVLRGRYNISTSDTSNWGNTALDSKSNGANSPIKGDPYVNVAGKNLSLALNTNQYGRTFQDRSHVFKIRPRPKGVAGAATIWNLNVRGKRGNIVQAYPAVEYDFTPSHLDVTLGDYVHFQWTGCDTNPAGSAGEGLTGSDRSNIVQIRDRSYNIPLSETDFKKYKVTPMFDNQSTRDRMAHLMQQDCLSLEDLEAAGNEDQNPQNCFKLNAAPTPYFNGGLIRMNKTGTFYYMSTRNNNFTNRSQKGSLNVKPLLPAYGVALVVIGGVAAVSVGAAAGSVIYSKRNPHSRVAGFVGKMPLLNRI